MVQEGADEVAVGCSTARSIEWDEEKYTLECISYVDSDCR